MHKARRGGRRLPRPVRCERGGVGIFRPRRGDWRTGHGHRHRGVDLTPEEMDAAGARISWYVAEAI